MSASGRPLVSVVTPVFNGERYLADCIASVLAQTYPNFEYVIVNNQSTDGTRRIAERFAATDSRMRIVDTPSFFKIIDNWNFSIKQIHEASAYCKELHADDLLEPTCLEKMVALAEAHPTVGIVGSYVRKGNRVVAQLPYSDPVVSGREVCARTLLRHFYAFGSPTSLLVRSEIVRTREPFYDTKYYHADADVCFAILRSWDFGFVYQVLSMTREHDESVSSTFAGRMRSNVVESLGRLRTYGPEFLPAHVYERWRREELKNYYRFLARNVVFERDREVWKFQRETLVRMGYEFDRLRFARALWWLFAEHVFNPKRTLGEIIRRWRSDPRALPAMPRSTVDQPPTPGASSG